MLICCLMMLAEIHEGSDFGGFVGTADWLSYEDVCPVVHIFSNRSGNIKVWAPFEILLFSID